MKFSPPNIFPLSRNDYSWKNFEQNRLSTLACAILFLNGLESRPDMSRPVILVDYDIQWPIQYEEEKRRVFRAIGDKVAAIEHIGSTSVSGLGSKPIIDIMVGVLRSSEADECLLLLEPLGYSDVTLEPEELDWYYCLGKTSRDGMPSLLNYHLHLVRFLSNHWKKHLLFRDYLRSHSDVAKQYNELKKEMAVKYGSDRIGYTNAKASFIESVIARVTN